MYFLLLFKLLLLLLYFYIYKAAVGNELQSRPIGLVQALHAFIAQILPQLRQRHEPQISQLNAIMFSLRKVQYLHNQGSAPSRTLGSSFAARSITSWHELLVLLRFGGFALSAVVPSKPLRARLPVARPLTPCAPPCAPSPRPLPQPVLAAAPVLSPLQLACLAAVLVLDCGVRRRRGGLSPHFTPCNVLPSTP